MKIKEIRVDPASTFGLTVLPSNLVLWWVNRITAKFTLLVLARSCAVDNTKLFAYVSSGQVGGTDSVQDEVRF